MGIRGINALTGDTAYAAALTAGPLLGAVSAAGALAVSGHIPWASTVAEQSSSQTIPLIGQNTTFPDLLGGLITFMDMNAEMATIRERRRMAVISIPGRESDFLQDLGGHTVRYSIRGKFYETDPQYLTHRGIMQTILKTLIGNAAVGSTQMLRLIMRTASPVPFITEHEISFAVINNFDITQTGGEPVWVKYNMELLEYQRIPYLAKMAMLGASNYVSAVSEE
ncbi:MAG: hypothetical protein PVG65_02640 [Candidatus Thorarchaeota archaeon]